jgi:hypothetical protein
MRKSRKHARRDARDNEMMPQGRGPALDIGGMLDVARCPLCEGPMTPRLDRRGPYFYCFCHARREVEETPVLKKIDNRLLASCARAVPSRFPSCNSNLSSVG